MRGVMMRSFAVGWVENLLRSVWVERERERILHVIDGEREMR
jgi:hypothetical protein